MARGGLPVTFRLEGERDGLDEVTAHVAYRIVQESLTNALRHAPGADVQVLVRGGSAGGSATVRVENGPAPGAARPALVGTGRGLIGLRERVVAIGGTFDAGPSASGGWLVEAVLRG